MRYHVPFAHRNRNHRSAGPVYIGFDEPVSIQKRKQRFNWSGFLGMLMALISPFTLFLLAPLALLFSLFGLRRAPRGMAVWGLILSMLATAALSVGVFGIASSRHHRYRQHQAHIVQVKNRSQIKETMAILEEAKSELREFRNDNSHQLPSLDDGMMITVRHDDAWDQPLRYGTTEYGCVVRSTGPDLEFNTSDDLTVQLDGTPMTNSVLDELLGETSSETKQDDAEQD